MGGGWNWWKEKKALTQWRRRRKMSLKDADRDGTSNNISNPRRIKKKTLHHTTKDYVSPQRSGRILWPASRSRKRARTTVTRGRDLILEPPSLCQISSTFQDEGGWCSVQTLCVRVCPKLMEHFSSFGWMTRWPVRNISPLTAAAAVRRRMRRESFFSSQSHKRL